MSALTLTRRQVRAMLTLARMEDTLGGRVPVADEVEKRYSGANSPPVTDEKYLTADEMRDLHVRLHEFCFPRRRTRHPVRVEVEG